MLTNAERSGISQKVDTKRYYQIAFGSLRECQSIIQLVKSNDSEIVKLLEKLAAHLYKLIKATT